MPSKTWSIMACESAVVANFDEGEMKKIIEDNECGVFTKAGNVDAFVDAVVKLSESPEIYQRMGRNGRSFVMGNLEKEVCTKMYVEILKSVIRN